MRLVVGIILVILLMVVLVAYMILMLNAHEMVFCGDITDVDRTKAMVTRVYTTDVSADETLSEIVLTMSGAEQETLSDEQLTQILAEYQNIIYAPVFFLDVQQMDESTYIISGSVYNGINDKGEPEHADYIYDNLRLDVAATNARIVMAENIYPVEEDKKDKDEDVLKERKLTIDPIIFDDDRVASFAFNDWDSFRMIVKSLDDNFDPRFDFIYTYNVVAENPLDFTGVDNGALAVGMTIVYDENGNLAPQYETIKTTVIEVDD